MKKSKKERNKDVNYRHIHSDIYTAYIYTNLTHTHTHTSYKLT